MKTYQIVIIAFLSLFVIALIFFIFFSFNSHPKPANVIEDKKPIIDTSASIPASSNVTGSMDDLANSLSKNITDLVPFIAVSIMSFFFIFYIFKIVISFNNTNI